MSLFMRIRHWLWRKKSPQCENVESVAPVVARDIGVRIIRIRLPSGYQVIIVERTAEDE